MEAHFSISPEGEISIILSADTQLALQPVTSSRLTHAGYAEDLSLCFLAFPPSKTQPQGSIYEYRGVELDTWEGFEEAESKGSYAIARIIGKRGAPAPYPVRKLDAFREADASADPSQAAPAKDVAAVTTSPNATILNVSALSANGSKSGADKPARAAEDTIPDLPERDEELPGRALSVRSAALAFVISSPALYEQAANRLKAIKAERGLMEARARRFYDPAYATYIEARTLRDEALKPYDEAEKLLKSEMLRFHQLEERQRREAEQIERRRLEEASRAQAQRESIENAKRDAEYARAQGEEKLAQSIEAAPLPVAPKPIAPVVMARAIPTTQGVARAENWTFRIVDAQRIPLSHEYYTLDERKIGAKAKLLKSHASIPGVEVYDAGSIRVR